MAGMEPRILRVSEADAVRDLAAILQRAQAGTEVVIERDAQPLAIIRDAAPERRTISQCIALAEAHERNPAAHRCSTRISQPMWTRLSGNRKREPADMRLALDSSVVGAGEQRGHTVRQILEQ